MRPAAGGSSVAASAVGGNTGGVPQLQTAKRLPRRPPAAVIVALVGCAGVAAAGCRPGPPRRPLQDRDPVFVIPAIKTASQDNDKQDVPRLIQLLSSDDAAIRAFADEGLRRLTGEDFAYRFWANDTQRREAVGRWKIWAVSRGYLPPDAAPPRAATTGPFLPPVDRADPTTRPADDTPVPPLSPQ